MAITEVECKSKVIKSDSISMFVDSGRAPPLPLPRLPLTWEKNTTKSEHPLPWCGGKFKPRKPLPLWRTLQPHPLTIINANVNHPYLLSQAIFGRAWEPCKILRKIQERFFFNENIRFITKSDLRSVATVKNFLSHRHFRH